jgi:hypothetical protein
MEAIRQVVRIPGDHELKSINCCNKKLRMNLESGTALKKNWIYGIMLK